ncbi:MAG: uridine diphosphate-N-acetylglucosamine-binding protein YvcK [Actinomycetaceae bacterium]|nr:uridine diphosphate-N-acetylglucosamine-binding protein YvcK [Actinomycetaceae bacterium]MDY5855042.1 uridine diphosphate-N-acetylglucosamine-binding protein YvcK [Arcanobacterium sp.]
MQPPIGAGGVKVVALGGGHGLYASLSALKLLTRQITAIVTVADDGGSSGRLRKELGGLPPGDLRMALSALCEDSQWGQTWRDVLQYRFRSEGELNGHALGNLLIEGLWDLLGDSVDGLDWVGKLLDVRGRVIPMAGAPLEIEADVVDSERGTATLYGQNNVAKSRAPIRDIRITPADPPVYPEALAAITEADWVIFGPGSWFTSVIPHLLVPRLREALERSRAKKMLVLNLQADSETVRFDAAAHVLSFHERAPSLPLDIVLADPDAVQTWEPLRAAAALCGARVMAHPVATSTDLSRHDPLYLAAAYRRIFLEVAH